MTQPDQDKVPDDVKVFLGVDFGSGKSVTGYRCIYCKNFWCEDQESTCTCATETEK